MVAPSGGNSIKNNARKRKKKCCENSTFLQDISSTSDVFEDAKIGVGKKSIVECYC